MICGKFNKLLLTACTVAALFFSLSICAFAAQIESLSVEDGVIRACVSGDNVAMFAAGYDGTALNTVFSSEADNSGYLEFDIDIGSGDEYTLYLWDKDTLAPLSLPYSLKGGRAYADGSSEPVPTYSALDYEFDQSVNVVIVSSVTNELIEGYQAGVKKEFPLAPNVTVLGWSDDFEHIVPGCVILPSVPKNGTYNAIELLATIGMPVNSLDFINLCLGEYEPSDSSTNHTNVFARFVRWENGSPSAPAIRTRNDISTTDQTVYSFAKNRTVYRVDLDISEAEDDSESPKVDVSLTSGSITSGLLMNTNNYYNYLYMRRNEGSGLITEAVLYYVPKNYNPGAGEGDWSPIYRLDHPTDDDD